MSSCLYAVIATVTGVYQHYKINNDSHVISMLVAQILFSVLDYLCGVNLQHGHHLVIFRQCCNVFLQTTESPDDLLQKRTVVLNGVLISEEIYLTELETLLTVL